MHAIDLKYAQLNKALSNEYLNSKMTRREVNRGLRELDKACRAEFIAAGLDPAKSIYLAGK